MRKLLLAFLLIFTVGCDGLTEFGGSANEPALARAEATSPTRVLAHFDRPLDPASVTPSAFVVTSTLDNGRSSQQAAASVGYVGGPSNTVELTLRAPGLGNGSHSVVAEGMRDLDGREAEETSVSFDFSFVVKSPTGFRVDRIVVTFFPGTDPGGDTWDWDPFFSGPRRPDIYVQFQDPARGLSGVLFTSEIHDDASPSRDYTFDDSASVYDRDVPFTADYATTYLLSLVDDDSGGNTTMVQADVFFPSLYRRDNATSDALFVSGARGFTAVLHGNWLY